MLSHQLPMLPPLNDFWDALPEIFNWILGNAPIPQRALIQRGTGEMPIRSRVLPMSVPLPSRPILRSFVSQRRIISVSISVTMAVFAASSRIRFGRRPRETTYCAPSVVIQESTGPIAWTGCRERR